MNLKYIFIFFLTSYVINNYIFNSVNETDGSFFEKFSGLQWKLDQRRLQMVKDSRQEESPPPEMSIGVKPPHVSSIQPKEVNILKTQPRYL